MSLEEYQERATALGVERGALALGVQFPEGDGPLGNAAIGHERSLLNERARLRVNRETLGLPVEDLTYLNPRLRKATARQAKRRDE